MKQARSAPHHRCTQARNAIRFYAGSTHRWQARHDQPLTAQSVATGSPSCRYVRWAAHLWQKRSRTARREFELWFRVTYAKYECIHLGEGSWDAANGGYGGGLQMDFGFQRTYGSEFLARFGPAGRWPAWAQLLAAERAFHGYHGYGPRGFGPWPNTARACGLR